MLTFLLEQVEWLKALDLKALPEPGKPYKWNQVNAFDKQQLFANQAETTGCKILHIMVK